MTSTLTAAITYQIALCDKLKAHAESLQDAQNNLDEWLAIKTNWRSVGYSMSLIEQKIDSYTTLINIHTNKFNSLKNKLGL